MDTFIDELVKRVHPMVVGKLNSDAYSTKHAEAIVKQVVLSVCNVALTESYKICSEILKGKLVCPKIIHCEKCVLKYLKNQCQS